MLFSVHLVLLRFGPRPESVRLRLSRLQMLSRGALLRPQSPEVICRDKSVLRQFGVRRESARLRFSRLQMFIRDAPSPPQSHQVICCGKSRLTQMHGILRLLRLRAVVLDKSHAATELPRVAEILNQENKVFCAAHPPIGGGCVRVRCNRL